MILHTTVPKELIFSNEFSSDYNERMVLYNGVPVTIEHLNNNEARITRLLSTNPADFLNSDLSPGNVIQLWNG